MQEFYIPKDGEVPTEFKGKTIPGKIFWYNKKSRHFSGNPEVDKYFVEKTFREINDSINIMGYISYETIMLKLGLPRDPDEIDSTLVYRAGNGTLVPSFDIINPPYKGYAVLIYERR